MRAFLVKSFFFSLTFILLSYFIDYVIGEGLKKSNYREITKWDEIVNKSIDAERLVIGSSRAYVHFDPKLIEEYTGKSFYNLGFDGSAYLPQKRKLELYLSHNKVPEHVYWVLDLHSFTQRDELYGFEQLIPYINNPYVTEILKLNTVYPMYYYHLPILRYGFKKKLLFVGLKSYFGIRFQTDIYKGYRSVDKVWDGKFEEAQEQYQEGIVMRADTSYINDFKQYVQFLQAKGVKVSTVFVPIYYESSQLVINQQEMIDSLRGLSESLNIPFYDYSKDSINYHKQYFYNATHLNKTGAELFTKKFIRDALQGVELK